MTKTRITAIVLQTSIPNRGFLWNLTHVYPKITNMSILLHIATTEHWMEAQSSGRYRPPSLATEGFIHCSKPEQLIGVANAIYGGQTDLLLLQIDPDRVPAEIKYEDCYESGQEFPHIYGPLPLAAVTQVVAFRPGSDGLFTMPDGL